MALPPNFNSEADEEFDVDLLISEIKKCPALYNYNPKDNFKEEKTAQWCRLGHAVLPDWHNYDVKTKLEKGTF